MGTAGSGVVGGGKREARCEALLPGIAGKAAVGGGCGEGEERASRSGDTPREYSSEENRRENRFSLSDADRRSWETDGAGSVNIGSTSGEGLFLDTRRLALRWDCSSPRVEIRLPLASLSSLIVGGEDGSWRRVTGGDCALHVAGDGAGELAADEYRLLKVGTLKLGAAGEDVRLSRGV